MPHLHSHYNTGIMTVNFFTPLHIDQADGYALTNCLYSPPEWWMTPVGGTVPKAVFSLGNSVFSLSDYPLQITFLANHSYHSTGIPSDVVMNPPQSLVNNKVIKTVMDDKPEVTRYLRNSLIAWGVWDRTRRQRIIQEVEEDEETLLRRANARAARLRQRANNAARRAHARMIREGIVRIDEELRRIAEERGYI